MFLIQIRPIILCKHVMPNYAQINLHSLLLTIYAKPHVYKLYPIMPNPTYAKSYVYNLYTIMLKPIYTNNIILLQISPNFSQSSKRYSNANLNTIC